MERTASNFFSVESFHGGFGIFLILVVHERVKALEQKSGKRRHTRSGHKDKGERGGAPGKGWRR